MSNASKKELRNHIVQRFSENSEITSSKEDLHIETLGERLAKAGVSRRTFMKYCMGLSAMMAIPAGMMPKLVEAALTSKVPSILYLSFQECTGCLESLVNVFPNSEYKTDSIENIILTALSLDYSETLMAASGTPAPVRNPPLPYDNLADACKWNAYGNTDGGYILVVDGGVPIDKVNGNPSGFFIQRGKTAQTLLVEALTGGGKKGDPAKAAFVASIGTCASFGGLPAAKGPDGLSPTGATSVKDALNSLGYSGVPVVNVSGCPPIAEVIAGTLIFWLINKKVPECDSLLRPKMFYGETVHDECYRKEFFEHGLFVENFDDAGARKGYCLLNMGCKGPVSHNACSELKWNQRTGFPMEAGHGCLGCSEPGFWDGLEVGPSGTESLYTPLDRASIPDDD